MRARKRHVQQELFRHGGKRRGAGRPAKGARPSQPHKKRVRFRASEPVLVTLRIAGDVKSLRTRDLYRALRCASFAVAAQQQHRFRIIHLSVQDDHIHLICEADDAIALARGLQSFEGSAAKRINRVMGRRGCAFPDRYHVRILKSPTFTHHAISYVLNNWRRHRKDELGEPMLVDPRSSGSRFLGWKHLDGEVLWRPPANDDSPWVFLPQTWLLREGWRRGGPPISALSVPGA